MMASACWAELQPSEPLSSEEVKKLWPWTAASCSVLVWPFSSVLSMAYGRMP